MLPEIIDDTHGANFSNSEINLYSNDQQYPRLTKDNKHLVEDVSSCIFNRDDEDHVLNPITRERSQLLKLSLDDLGSEKRMNIDKCIKLIQVYRQRLANPFVQQARSLITETLKRAGGREIINNLIEYVEQEVNTPARYEQDKINILINIFDALRNKYTLREDEPTKEKINLNFQDFLMLNTAIRQSLEDKNLNSEDYLLIKNLGKKSTDYEEIIGNTLDKINLKQGDVVRMLEPGNNDQAAPMFLAQKIRSILKYAEAKNIFVNVQVLVMGKGGHATTANFPQFAQLTDKNFSGTCEADSLSDTLRAALTENNISSEIVENFSLNTASKDLVQIQLARDSTNTGENVSEASRVYHQGKGKPRHVFVCAASPSSARQVLTFAQQYSDDRNNPSQEKNYDTITSIPPSKTKNFIENGMTNYQAVTELYAGLAERTRLYAYAFNPDTPYIPAAPFNVNDLEHLYTAYDLLSGSNDLENSKQMSIQTVLQFFQNNFSMMEKGIVWNKEAEQQLPGTHQAMKMMVSRFNTHVNLNSHEGCEFHHLRSRL